MREIRLEKQIERATHDPKEQESKLVVVVGRIVGWLRNGSADWAPNQDEILERLSDLADSYKIAQALERLGQWEVNREYNDGAAEALPLLREVAEEALNDGWPNFGLYAYTLAGELARELGSDDELESITDILYPQFVDHWAVLSPNTRGQILDATGYLLSGLNQDNQSDIVNNLDEISVAAHEDYEFSFERRILDKIESLNYIGEASESEIQDRLVLSFEQQLDVQNRTGSHEAHVLQEALSRCAEFLSFAQQNEWKSALRRAHRDSIDDMAEYTHEPSDAEIDELDESLEQILRQAEQIADQTHSVHALYYLLARPEFLPSATRDWDGERGVPITDIFSRLNLTGEGDAIPERDDSNRHSQYGISTQFRDNILTTLIGRALERRIITEGSLYLYLWSIDGISVDDIAYLTDMIISHFDGRYADSIHMGVARLEGVIASMLQNEGIETASLRDGYLTPTPLPGLLNILERLGVDLDLIEYLRYKYADTSGMQIRNKVAHGRAGYQWAAWNISLVLLFDIVLTIGWLEERLRYYAE
jgi:hypothetical protein